jgi:hypothetical protein
MVAVRKLSGLWRGRLVDIQGFEGELELDLKGGSAGQLTGTFNVSIAANHAPIRQRGAVEGKFSDDKLTLALVGKDLPVKIGLIGDVLDLRDGGVGLRGSYEVSAKTFSPLQGGVACAAKDQKFEDDVASRRDKR